MKRKYTMVIIFSVVFELLTISGEGNDIYYKDWYIPLNKSLHSFHKKNQQPSLLVHIQSLYTHQAKFTMY